MSNAGISNYSPTLYNAALGYLKCGYSVLPVRGKVAAAAWGQYQQRRPTSGELHRWFVEQGHTGLAIVTGDVSGLIVLDFDDLDLFAFFQNTLPDLAATRAVRTRRGVHLWFHILPDQHVQSRKGQGYDLKAAGGYVVAPPTIIDGHAYTIIQHHEPITLTDADLSRIQAFFDALAITPAAPGPKSQEGAFSCEIEPSVKICSNPLTPFVTSHDLVSRYRCYTRQGSRNDALFNVSRYARDQGYTVQPTIDTLADLHARQPANGPHRPESYPQRYREAVATILSAYSRPPRRPVEPGRADVQQLPNSVREALFQRKQTYTVRVIEGLRLAGVQPGQSFTTSEALKLLKGRVGRDSIYNALKAVTHDGQAIFAGQTPFPRPQTPKTSYADDSLVNDQTKECSLVKPKNQEKGRYHRPARVFIMPSNEELCLKLGVRLTHSDPLTQDDLASAKQTRMAAHREFIRRRPGMYPRRWLARRLGVCTDTLDAYNHEIPINVRHCYFEKTISWSNLGDIPLALEVEGMFLEDDTGKRYPARREIARKLLAHKRSVTLKRQDINFYWYDDPQAHPLRPAAPRVHKSEAAAHAISYPHYAIVVYENTARSHPTAIPAPHQPTPTSRPATPAQIPDSAAAQERMAERAYTTVSRLSTDNAQRISKANARKLVETYGVAAVEQGIQRLNWYAGKGRVEKPAGFLITASRLAWREQHEAGVPAPTFRGETRPLSRR